MKRLVLLFALIALAGACTSDSNLPNPTGKGTIRALNAIKASPPVNFRIEERLLDSLGFKAASTGARYDDFDYIFNFEVRFLNDTQPTRIASQPLKIDAGQDYTLVLTGDINAPDVTVWQAEERDWGGTETVFQIRFAHTAETLGPVDVYFAPDGTAPAQGEERGTLSFGEILPAIDIESADYVMTITTAGDDQDILFQTAPITYSAQNILVMSVFDGDERDTSPVVATLFNALGAAAPVTDVNSAPTIRFMQASLDLPNSDVYDDEMLTNQVLSDHAFGDVTADIDFQTGTTTYTYTTVGDTSAVLFEGGIAAAEGRRYDFIVIGREGERFTDTLVSDRQSISLYAKIGVYHAAFDNVEVDFYIVDSGETIDEVTPVLGDLTYSLNLPSLAYDTGVYDVYVTLPNEKTIIGGPLEVTVDRGDVVQIFLYDNVDPAIVDLVLIPTP